MQPANTPRNGIVIAALVGLIVGVLVAVVCYLLGAIPHLDFLRTYDTAIGLIAGILTFLQRWLGWSL